MPYEYRRLTPQEREEVLRQRLESGHPWHAPPHPFRGQACYLLTGTNFEHVHIMAQPERRTGFEPRLLAAMRGIGAEVIAWVILPNHYHLLANVDSLDSVSAAFQHLHGVTSREWNLADGQTGKRRVWYRYSDRAIRNDAHFSRALNYIHINPVKHRYVEDPYEWPWSSLHGYLESHGREWLRAQWKAFPPDKMGKGWDE